MQDIQKYDYLTIQVKVESANQLIKDYAVFGWEKYEEREHQYYDNLKEISFRRLHKINNKDNLQFMQVNYESYVNKIGRLEKNKHSKSLIFGLSMFVLIATLIVLTVLNMDTLKNQTSMLICIICSVFALIFTIITAIITIKIVKKENDNFNSKIKEYKECIKNICESVSKINEE